MPPRIRLRSLAQLAESSLQQPKYVCQRCRYATVVTTTPHSTPQQTSTPYPPITRYPTTQPPSHRDPKYRKSQLIRSYVSLLESTPLIILFQHNNLKAVEWAAIRRELHAAMLKLDTQLQTQGTDSAELIGNSISLSVIQTNVFEIALRISEYYNPSTLDHDSLTNKTPIPNTNKSKKPQTMASEKLDPSLTHALSEAAYLVAQEHRNIHPLTPLLTGSVAILSFPRVSPQHIKTALSILSPKSPNFPAPTRRANPSYHDIPVQDGLKKLILLGARVEGQTFDMEGTRWVGSIQGGITGLRAQLVALLQGFGAGLTQTLESAGRNLWFTVEGRRNMLEEEARPKDVGEGKESEQQQQ